MAAIREEVSHDVCIRNIILQTVVAVAISYPILESYARHSRLAESTARRAGELKRKVTNEHEVPLYQSILTLQCIHSPPALSAPETSETQSLKCSRPSGRWNPKSHKIGSPFQVAPGSISLRSVIDRSYISRDLGLEGADTNSWLVRWWVGGWSGRSLVQEPILGQKMRRKGDAYRELRQESSTR